MAGLYQKPGRGSSEWALVKGYAGMAGGFALSGLISAAFDWPGHLAGLILLGWAPLIAIVPAVAYTLSRGKVKAAAETHKPPPSRVF